MSPAENRYDVIVIGGGPSGSSAACRLARNGVATLLLERSAMPRRKLCGGALSAQAMSYLDEPVPRRLIDRDCHGVRVHFGNRVVESRSQTCIAILVTRAKFDQYLVEQARAAGASVRFEKVVAVTPDDAGVGVVTGRGAYRCKAIVVAAGANSRLIEHVRPRDGKDAFAVTQEVEIPVGPEDRFADLDRMVDIHFGVARFGYGWLFHHGDHYSVGVGGLRSKMPRPDEVMCSFMRSIGLTGEYPGLKGHPIPRGGVPRRLVADRVVLVGDAAGFADPFYGEGIAYAIRSGQIAAEVIHECLARSETCTAAQLDEYARRCNAEFLADLSYSLRLSKQMYRFPGIFLRILASDRSFLEKYLEIPLSRLSCREFLRWMVPRLPWYLAKSVFT